jgi:hypothetical protein
MHGYGDYTFWSNKPNPAIRYIHAVHVGLQYEGACSNLHRHGTRIFIPVLIYMWPQGCYNGYDDLITNRHR